MLWLWGSGGFIDIVGWSRFLVPLHRLGRGGARESRSFFQCCFFACVHWWLDQSYRPCSTSFYYFVLRYACYVHNIFSLMPCRLNFTIPDEYRPRGKGTANSLKANNLTCRWRHKFDLQPFAEYKKLLLLVFWLGLLIPNLPKEILIISSNAICSLRYPYRVTSTLSLEAFKIANCLIPWYRC